MLGYRELLRLKLGASLFVFDYNEAGYQVF